MIHNFNYLLFLLSFAAETMGPRCAKNKDLINGLGAMRKLCSVKLKNSKMYLKASISIATQRKFV